MVPPYGKVYSIYLIILIASEMPFHACQAEPVFFNSVKSEINKKLYRIYNLTTGNINNLPYLSTSNVACQILESVMTHKHNLHIIADFETEKNSKISNRSVLYCKILSLNIVFICTPL